MQNSVVQACVTFSASDSVAQPVIVVQEESVVARPTAEGGVQEDVRMMVTERKMTSSVRSLRSTLGCWAGALAASGKLEAMV